MAEIPNRERETVVMNDSRGSSGAWIFGVIIAILAAIGIWYFAASGEDGSVTVQEPAATTSTEAPEAAAPAETAPAAPADDAAPAAPADDAAPATPAPAE